MRYLVTVEGETIELEVDARADGYRVRHADGRELAVSTLQREPGLLSLLIDGQVLEVQPDASAVRYRMTRYAARAETQLERAAKESKANDAALPGKLYAAMPGRVVRVLCEPGKTVEAGAPLLVIEAMKMQNELCASTDGIVRSVRVRVGDTVERGAVLVELVSELSPASRALLGARDETP